MSAFDDSIENFRTLIDRAQTVWRSFSRDEFGPRANRGSPLSKYYTIQSGQVDPRLDEFSDLPLVGPNHIDQINGRYLGAESAKEQNAISGKYLFEPNAILYSKIRPELRKAMVAGFRGLCSADMYPLMASPEIKNLYLLDLVLSDAFSAFAISCSMRTGMPKLNREQLRQFNFDLPPLEHQEKYVESVKRLRERDKALGDRLAKAIQMKKLAAESVFG